MQIKVEWDTQKETLTEFRTKWEAYRGYVEALQLKGTLPRTEIKWTLTTLKRPVGFLPLPNEPAMEFYG